MAKSKINLANDELTRADLRAKFTEIYFKSRDFLLAEKQCRPCNKKAQETGSSTADDEQMAEYIALLKSTSTELSALTSAIAETLAKCE